MQTLALWVFCLWKRQGYEVWLAGAVGETGSNSFRSDPRAMSKYITCKKEVWPNHDRKKHWAFSNKLESAQQLMF